MCGFGVTGTLRFASKLRGMQMNGYPPTNQRSLKRTGMST